MPEHADDDGSLDGYRLPGIWKFIAAKQIDMADRPDPRVFLVEEGRVRDGLIEEDRRRSAADPAYRRAKTVYDICRIEDGLPFLILRSSIDVRPISHSEEPGRMSWPEAQQWPEIRERSAMWFVCHPDDRVVPVPGHVDPETYWG